MSDKERMERLKKNSTDMIFFVEVFGRYGQQKIFIVFYNSSEVLKNFNILSFFLVLCSLDPTRLLLTFGACTTTQDKLHGNTALHWAILAQNHTAVSTLIMHGASLDIANAQVRTILCIKLLSLLSHR